MAKKKSLISQALIEAKELERAAIDNAKEMVLESFTPDFQDFFKSVLTEAEEYDEDMEDEDEDGEDEDLEEGNEHDLGKYPDPGREGTDPALDDDEEQGTEYQVSEGEYDDVKGDATPESGQAGLPGPKPKVKQTGDSGWDDDRENLGDGTPREDPEKGNNALPGKKPATKQTGDGGWEAEHEGGSKHADTANAVPAREKLAGTPKPKVVFAEAEDDEEAPAEEDDDVGDELDVPDELFDDSEEDEVEDDTSDDVELKDNEDEDVDLDIEDDEEKDEVNEEDEPDFEVDDEEDGEDEEDEPEDEKVNENLYIKTRDGFRKVTPASYLKNRLSYLEEQHNKAIKAIKVLRTQLQETHLYNAKLAHVNKLMMTGAFTTGEKNKIMEQIDECESIDQVKRLFNSIIKEVKDENPLDGFSKVIKEHRSRREAKTDNIYESADLKRMRQIIKYKG